MLPSIEETNAQMLDALGRPARCQLDELSPSAIVAYLDCLVQYDYDTMPPLNYVGDWVSVVKGKQEEFSQEQIDEMIEGIIVVYEVAICKVLDYIIVKDVADNLVENYQDVVRFVLSGKTLRNYYLLKFGALK